MKVQLTELCDTVNAGVAKLGYADKDAKVIADVLLYAQLRGNNQGITKIATGGVLMPGDVATILPGKPRSAARLRLQMRFGMS